MYRGPGKPTIETVPDPKLIDDTDAIVRIDTTTICGTDLHILNGDVPAVTDGRVLGQEVVGTVQEVGASVRTLAAGDRVLVSCIAAPRRRRDHRQPSRRPLDRFQTLTGGLGANVAIEAVGMPDTFELCTQLIRPGGRVANVGVHGTPATLQLEQLWIRNITITTGLVDTFTIPELLRLTDGDRIDPSLFVTHRFAMDQFADVYDTLAHAADSGALKVVISRT